MSLVKRVFEQV